MKKMKSIVGCLVCLCLLWGNMSAAWARELGPSSSAQLLFAKLQLEMAEKTREEAMGQMETIAQLQGLQRATLGHLQMAQTLSEQTGAADQAVAMPEDMKAFMTANGLEYPNGEALDKDGWKSVVDVLERYMSDLSEQTQQQMVDVQDFLGQYNSYLQGTHAQNGNTTQTLTSLARGQTMLGEEGVSMAFTSGLIGCVIGVLGTLLVLRLTRKEDRK